MSATGRVGRARRGRGAIFGRLGRRRSGGIRGGRLGRIRGGTIGRHRRVRLLVASALVLGAVLTGAWMWFRDSSLVAVERVTVTGVSGADAGQIRAALVAAGRRMTTLDVGTSQLRQAVAQYPVVQGLQVSSEFPHGMRIHVIEQSPVGVVIGGGREIPVSADGTLLSDVAVSATLPTIPVGSTPSGRRLLDTTALSAVSLIAAAPPQLLPQLSQVTSVAGQGLVAQVRGGPSIYFGSPTALAAKWIAASEVLADQGSAGASYIDVTDPQRPAAGAGSDQAATSGTSSTAAPTSTSAAEGSTSATQVQG